MVGSTHSRRHRALTFIIYIQQHVGASKWVCDMLILGEIILLATCRGKWVCDMMLT